MSGTSRVFGSDLAVDVLQQLGVEFIALNPGATLRGLHDSLVNPVGSSAPEIIDCLHENVAVGIAHGYAKATGRVMAAGLHNVVGLQNGSMAIFNAWTDHEGVILVGGTGPMDIDKRRPGIDWVHTALVQGNLIRDFTKWDDQPTSSHGVVESLLRGHRMALTEPRGPVYVCLDAALQEVEMPPEEVAALSADFERATPSDFAGATAEQLHVVAQAVHEAHWPVLLVERVGRSEAGFEALAELAETWGLPVVEAARKSRLNIATTHPMNVTGAGREMLERADVVVALDVQDLLSATTVTDSLARTSRSVLSPGARIFTVGVDELHHRGWLADYHGLVAVERSLVADSAQVLRLLPTLVTPDPARVEARRREVQALHDRLWHGWRRQAEDDADKPEITRAHLARCVDEVLAGEDFVIANGELRGWTRRLIRLDKPRQHLGVNVGGGLGYGLPATVGACLAHRGTGKVVVDLQSDGDLLYVPGALWTLAHHDLAALIVIDNNRSYGQDENHQAMIAKDRGRPVQRAGIGTRLEDPSVDLGALARSFGVEAVGPVTTPAELPAALRAGMDIVQAGRSVVVDVHTESVVGT